MKRNIKKTIVLIALLLVVTILSISFYSYLNNKDGINIIGIDREQFAMYRQDENGDYIEITDSNVFPDGYTLNLDTSVCVNKAGTEIAGALSLNDKNLTVTSDQTVFCSLYFDPKSEIEIAVTTDGVAGTVPSSYGYTKTVSCDDGNASWNYKYNRLEMNTMTSCNVSYTEKTSKPTLISKINEEKANTDTNDGFCTDSSYTKESTCTDAGAYWWGVYETNATTDYNHSTALSKSDYSTSQSMFSSSSYASTSGTTASSAFSYVTSTSEWTNNPSNMTSGTYYHFQFNVKEAGTYQLCYTMSTGHTSNLMYLYVGGSRHTLNGSNYLAANTSTATSRCETLGSLTAGTTIKVANRSYWTNSTTNDKATLTFSLQKARIYSNYRYRGKLPDNYVWFNNEMWRIIGSIGTCTSSDCGTLENLTKIIREEPLGGFAYEATGSSDYTKDWGSNTLYTLLNNYYYGGSNGADYCYGYANTAIGDCDYTYSGINPSSQYGKMVKNVYWNTGRSSLVAADTVYNAEKSVQTISGHVGLMTASDYAYAVIDEYIPSTGYLTAYDTKSQLQNNWLYYSGYEWTITQEATYNRILYIRPEGNVDYSYSHLGYTIRPVVYLDSSVYVLDGDGSITNPYIIAMD